MWAIIKREWKTYFFSLMTYVYYAIFFLITGILFVTNCLSLYSTQFGYYVLNRSFLVVVLMIPLCTMRLFAGERRGKTDQLLFTSPISSLEILLGKFFSTAVYLLLPVLGSVLYGVWISSCGTMNIRFLMCSYIAIFLVTMALLGMGMFISTLTTNTVLAAVLTYGLYGLLFLERLIETIVGDGGVLYFFFRNMSLYNKYYDMTSGIIRSGDVVFLCMTIILFLGLTWVSLESRRQQRNKILVYGVGLLLSFVLITVPCLTKTKVYDFTSEKLLTLSKETKEQVKGIAKETQIFYMGKRSNANASYQEFLKAYEDLNDKISIQYVDVNQDVAFRSQYLSDYAYINEASLLVSCGDRILYLDSNDYVSKRQTGVYSYESLLNIEQQLTQAIVYTNSDTANEICVLEGHGETPLDAKLENLLKLNRFKTKKLNLETIQYSVDETIPEDCKAIILNSPETDLSEGDVDVLNEYVEEGGQLVICMDALNEELPNLYQFLSEHGLIVKSGVLVEQDAGGYAYNTPYYIIPSIQDTQYTNEIIKNTSQVLAMTSKAIVRKSEKNGYKATPLLLTSGTAIAKGDNYENLSTKGKNDAQGSFSVASVAQKDGCGGVLLISTDMLLNQQVNEESGNGNYQFFVSVLQKITGAEAGIWIKGKNMSGETALYPNTKQSQIKLIMLVIIPVCVLLAGVILVICDRKNIFCSMAISKKGKEEMEKSEEAGAKESSEEAPQDISGKKTE